MRTKNEFLLKLCIFYLLCITIFAGTFVLSYHETKNNPDAVATVKESAIKNK